KFKKDWFVRFAKNPHCPADILNDILCYDNVGYIINNPNCHDGLLSRISNEYPTEFILFINSKECSQEFLLKLLSDLDSKNIEKSVKQAALATCYNNVYNKWSDAGI